MLLYPHWQAAALPIQNGVQEKVNLQTQAPPPENEQELEKGMKSYITVGHPLSDTYLLRDKVPLLRHLCTSTVYYLLCWTE